MDEELPELRASDVDRDRVADIGGARSWAGRRPPSYSDAGVEPLRALRFTARAIAL